MSTLIDELHSFVEKLSQLHYCGINASLNLNTYNGKMYASLHAELNSSEMEYDARNFYAQPQPKKTKPSRLKRQLQRKQAFNNNTNEVSTPPAEVGSESADTNLLPDNDQSLLSSKPNIVGDASEMCDLTCGEPALGINDDGTPWTPPSEEDILEYLREHGHQAENQKLCCSSDAREGAVKNFGLPFSK